MVEWYDYQYILVIKMTVQGKNKEDADERMQDALSPLDCEILAEGMDRIDPKTGEPEWMT